MSESQRCSLSPYTRALIIQSVELASQRAAIDTRRTLSRGVASLSLVSSTAAFIGFFGTVLGISNSFPSIGTSKGAALGAIADRLSQAMAPGILGLLVAILAFCFYRYLTSQLEAFDLEMKSTSIDLVNRLAVHLERLRSLDPAPRPTMITGVERRGTAWLPALQMNGPEFILRRMHRNGLLELIWPRIESEVAARVILDGGGLLCFVYAAIGSAKYCLQGRLTASLILLGFLGISGLAIRRGSRVALIAAYSFLSATAVASLLSRASFVETICLFGAALLLNGSWRAVQWSPGAAGIRPQVPRISTPLVVALTVSLSIGVLFHTVLGVYHTGPYDDSMESTIHDQAWEIGLNSRFADQIQRAQVWQVDMYIPGVARVVGLPGDRVRIKEGVLILNGKRLAEPYRSAYADPEGDFPLPAKLSSDSPLRAYYELAYGVHVKTNAEYVVPQDLYFVLNDNREVLSDSRRLGPVRRDQFIARLMLAIDPTIYNLQLRLLR